MQIACEKRPCRWCAPARSNWVWATRSKVASISDDNEYAVLPSGCTWLSKTRITEPSLRTTQFANPRLWRGYDACTPGLRPGRSSSILRVFAAVGCRRACRWTEGRTVASASYDGTLRLWHVATGQDICVLLHVDHPLKYCRFYNDGRTLVA